ncbi:hypothetical protein BJ912DRAFT_961034 [Pholiota molesta]|nr:hypothetical protein BJ912DRAFT_961034 [Pholiota molesta]
MVEPDILNVDRIAFELPTSLSSSFHLILYLMVGRALIDYLPNELLEKIFDIGARVPFPVDDRYPHRPLFSKIPMGALYASALSQVCIRWREMVFQMPVVWTYIHLTRTLDSHRRLKTELGHSLKWLPTYLMRSRNLPLHITLDTTRIPADAALALISPHSSRWCTFTLLVSHVGTLPPVLPLLVRTRVPHLQYLSIASDIYREGIVSYDPFVPFFVTGTPTSPPYAERDMFDASPMLERLVIHDDIASVLRHVQQPPSRPTVTLATLKYLEIEVSLLGLFSMSILEVLVIKAIKADEWLSIRDEYDLPLRAFPGPVQANRARERALRSPTSPVA